MSRLQKKCLVASMAMHGLLVALLFIGPAFLMRDPKPPSGPVVTFLPANAIAVDAPVASGGSPTAVEPPAPAVIPPTPAESSPPPTVSEFRPKPVSEPPPKAAEPPAPKVKPAPPKVSQDNLEPVKNKKDKTPPKPEDEVTPAQKKISRKIEPTFDKVSPSDNETSRRAAEVAEAKRKQQAREAALAAARAQEAFAAQVAKLGERLGSGLSSSTSIEVPGPGGAAYADYRLFVQMAFAQRWQPPADLNDDGAVTRARVVIRRDGTVSEARIIKSSGHRDVDRSVERALELKTIGRPFPDGAKDLERTFNINFDLKTKRSG